MDKEDRSIDKILEDFEISIISITLYCLSELPLPLGVKRTIDVLKGNRNAFAQNHGLITLRTFSALPGFTRDQLSDIFDVLILQGYVDVVMVSQDEEEFPVMAINKKGLSYLRDGSEAGLSVLNILMDKDVPGIPDDDQDLFYKLKLTRRQLAEEYDYPAFMVCGDSVLQEICLRKPTEPDELIKIAGVDMAFMKHYSKQILYVIRQYVTREKGS
jgi:ATP-dependent DNA helicase RecQ